MDTKERKIMTKTVKIGKSKKGNIYMFTEGKSGRLFVNLIKDNKKFEPKIPDKARSADIDFTSYLYDDDNDRLVLFDVKDIVFNS